MLERLATAPRPLMWRSRRVRAMNLGMKRIVSAFVVVVALFASRVFALTDADTAALKQLTKDYASWDYSGVPWNSANGSITSPTRSSGRFC